VYPAVRLLWDFENTDRVGKSPSLRIFKESCLAGCWWLTPVILATQETEIRRIAIQSQSRQIVQETLS
jgi:hypothetical protein